MSHTPEITLWCDDESCSEWIQFNHHEAGGVPARARALAKQRGWSWSRKDGTDWCRRHNSPRHPPKAGAPAPDQERLVSG